MTHGAVRAVERRPATKVVVFQWPCGILPTSRSPRGARPRSRAILVEVPVSSMKTSRSGSSLGRLSAHAVRAAATSGRSCSAARTLFFEADAVAVEEPPDRTEPRLLLALIEQTALDLLQCQVGLLPNQRKQPFLMLLQRRPALALVGFGLEASGLPPALRPADRRRIPNHKLPCRRPRRRATLNNLDHSNSQIVRIPHCRPPLPEKATESYSRLLVNPFDSQKMENALGPILRQGEDRARRGDSAQDMRPER